MENFSDKKKILIADDNSLNANILGKILLKLGFDISIASNGEEAIQCVKNELFDAVFMDIHMPVMNGITAVQLIKTFNLEKQPYSIAVTGDFFERGEEELLRYGFDCYINKPLSLEKVSTILKKKL